VALELMRLVVSAESPSNPDGAYWLKAYEAALTVVSHGAASEAIKQLPKK